MSTNKSPQPGSNGLPPANAHAARRSARSPSDPDVILPTLPVGTPHYLRVLGAILKKFNHRHSTKHKGVSFKTMLDRQRLYASFFRELRHHTPYRNLDPRQLANRHIEAMVERWVARGLSTATLHNYLSFLRTYGAWTSSHTCAHFLRYAKGRSQTRQILTGRFCFCLTDVSLSDFNKG